MYDTNGVGTKTHESMEKYVMYTHKKYISSTTIGLLALYNGYCIKGHLSIQPQKNTTYTVSGPNLRCFSHRKRQISYLFYWQTKSPSM